MVWLSNIKPKVRKVSPYEKAKNIVTTSPVWYIIKIIKNWKITNKLKKINNNSYKDTMSGVIFNLAEAIQQLLDSDKFRKVRR